MNRTIYFRIDGGAKGASGSFSDLKTLKGATRRLERMYPGWTEIEVQYDKPVGA